jgi:hypothetical protein
MIPSESTRLVGRRRASANACVPGGRFRFCAGWRTKTSITIFCAGYGAEFPGLILCELRICRVILRMQAWERARIRYVRSFGNRRHETGLSGVRDEVLLRWAAAEERVLLTHDVSTITEYAYRRVLAG